jgi:hypothetical protein
VLEYLGNDQGYAPGAGDEMVAAAPPPFPARDTEGLVFLDETGTPDYLNPTKLTDYHTTVAAGRKASYPILFGLAGVLFRRSDYFNGFDDDFRALKVRHLGADVPMHEYDLRRLKEPPFDALRDPAAWTAFRGDLARLFAAHDFGIIACGIHKPDMQGVYPAPFHPYNYSLENIVERAAMESKNYARTWRVVAEDREKGLNDELSREMLRLQLYGCGSGIANPHSNVDADEVRRKFALEIRYRKKSENDSGLQVADLAVGPIIRRMYGLDTGEKRTLLDIVLPKVCRARDGKLRGFGLKAYPWYPPACPL